MNINNKVKVQLKALASMRKLMQVLEEYDDSTDNNIEKGCDEEIMRRLKKFNNLRKTAADEWQKYCGEIVVLAFKKLDIDTWDYLTFLLDIELEEKLNKFVL